MKSEAVCRLKVLLALLGGTCLSLLRLAGANSDEHWDTQFPRPMDCQFLQALMSDGDSLYAAGIISPSAHTNANLCRWDGMQWRVIGSATGGGKVVSGFVRFGIHIYVAGDFLRVNDVPASGLARWDGTNWSGVAGFSGTAYALASDGTSLFVGGSFTNVGGMPIRFIARWNGTTWSGLGTGPNGDVSAIVVNGADVYAGGSFTIAGDVSANHVAKWNGSAWSALGTANVNGMSGPVAALTMNGSNLYAGGRFFLAGGTNAGSIAKWDGSLWSVLGTGITGAPRQIRSLVFVDGILYAGGSFTHAGGTSAVSLAAWDGASWSSLGSGLAQEFGAVDVFVLAAKGADLFVGGSFTSAGGKPARYFARWNEELSFDPLSMTLVNPQLFTNGRFRFRVMAAGAVPYVIEASTNFGSWVPLLTNSVSPFDFEDVSPLSGNRFYRTRQQ